ncbi:hypothetical protein HKX48_004277 [Thoreauomyces humboldtii]|nr:hypothetical protein HKX48_004277 [Thoreauomyces humboldtii]
MVRIKNRWLLIRVHLEPSRDSPAATIDTSLTSKSIYHLLKDSLQLNFGDYGAGISASSIGVKYFSPFTHTGIIRCSRDQYQMIWAALTFVTKCKGTPCVIRVLHNSGTIKKIQEETVACDRAVLGEMERKGLITPSQTDTLLAKVKEDLAALDS